MLTSKILTLGVVALAIWITSYTDGYFVLWIREESCAKPNQPPLLSWRSQPQSQVVHWKNKQTLDPCRYFSETYQVSKQRFYNAIVALKEANGDDNTIEDITVFVDPQHPEFTMDVVKIPGSQPGIVLHTSGTHGVEGYAGAAIQLAFLDTLLHEKQQEQDRPERPTVILIHAVNPHGMAHNRRVNHNNVDLNRNALTPEQWMITHDPQSHWQTHVKSTYNAMSQALFRWPTAPQPYTSLGTLLYRAGRALSQYGLRTLKTVMVTGQYHSPTDIFYGGNQLESNWVWLSHVLDTELLSLSSPQDRDNTTTTSITWVDIHTGLGPLGVDTLLVKPNVKKDDDDDAASPSNAKATTMKEQIEQWFPGALHPFSNQQGSAVAQGYERVQGFVSNYFEPFLRAKGYAQPWVVTQEFGTLPTPLVGLALVLEQAAQEHHTELEATKWSYRTTRRAFYPQSQWWRTNVLYRGLTVLDQAMTRSMALSSSSP